ncbi:hypothetical protein FQA39_LY07809 [Lamprigera yunnana]|nr:hypothetical protein FQA39_LY07809 [Lamprigera yunnana]
MSRKRNSTAMQNTIVSRIITRLQSVEKSLHSLTSEVKSLRSDLEQLQEDDVCDAQPTKKAHCDFVRESGFVVVFTDGACENNGKKNARAGIGVWFDDNHPLNLSQPVNGRATNNTAEIQACIQAVKTAHANGVTKLKIKTDSEFVINSMTKWIFKWRINNWKVATGGDVKNKEDFVTLDNTLKLMEKVIWEHVDAHKGIQGNEAADTLAKAGALLYKP